MESKGQIDRGNRLIKLHNERKRKREAQELLEKLPQGEGSGLDADKLDGLHAEELIEKARIIVPASGSGGGTGMTQHGNEYHTPDFGLIHESHITLIAVASEVAF